MMLSSDTTVSAAATPGPAPASTAAAAAASKPKQPSAWARKLLQKLSGLSNNASLESRQTVASWIVFNRKRAEGLCEGLLIAVSQAKEDASTAGPRLLLLLQILHQVFLSNSPSNSESSNLGSNSDTWEKLTQLRMMLAESFLGPSLLESLAMASHSQYSNEVKEMMDSWKQHNVFGGPTIWEEYRKGWLRAVANAAAAAAAADNAPAGPESETKTETKIKNETETETENAAQNEAATTEDKPSLSEPSTALEQQQAALTTAAENTQTNGDDGKNISNNDKEINNIAKEEENETQEIKQEEKAITNELKMEVVDGSSPKSVSSGGGGGEKDDVGTAANTTKEEEIDFEGVEEAKVEPTQFLEACKVIASIQITRDLGSDAAMNLSSVLSNIPSDVEDACNIITSSKQQQWDKDEQIVTNLAELLPDDSLANLPDDLLDLDLQYARQSLQTYKEAIRQQRKARLQCLRLLLQSRFSFGSLDAALAFGCGGNSGAKVEDGDNGNDNNTDMAVILEKLKERKEALSDAMALEGLDVEEDTEEEKKLEMKEEEGLKLLSWFPSNDKQSSKEESQIEEPIAKKAKL